MYTTIFVKYGLKSNNIFKYCSNYHTNTIFKHMLKLLDYLESVNNMYQTIKTYKENISKG